MSNYIAMRPAKRPKASEINWHLEADLPAHEGWRKWANATKLYVSYPHGGGGIYYPDYYKIVYEGNDGKSHTKYFYGETAFHKTQAFLGDLGHSYRLKY